jgi:hypothetical protein
LFLSKDEEIWGICEKSTVEARTHKVPTLSNTSLTNLVAIQVFLNGGLVYIENK